MNTKLNGPVVYTFDNATLLAQLSSQAAVDDFKRHVRSTAATWSTSTGVSITEGQPGQATNVTITTASDTRTRNGTAPCQDHWSFWGIYNNEGDLVGFYWEYARVLLAGQSLTDPCGAEQHGR